MEPLRANDPARISGYTLIGRLGTGGMGSSTWDARPTARRSRSR